MVLLGLTPEETEEVHEECLCAQAEIGQEIEEEDRVRGERAAERGVHDMHPQHYELHNIG